MSVDSLGASQPPEGNLSVRLYTFGQNCSAPYLKPHEIKFETVLLRTVSSPVAVSICTLVKLFYLCCDQG